MNKERELLQIITKLLNKLVYLMYISTQIIHEFDSSFLHLDSTTIRTCSMQMCSQYAYLILCYITKCPTSSIATYNTMLRSYFKCEIRVYNACITTQQEATFDHSKQPHIQQLQLHNRWLFLAKRCNQNTPPAGPTVHPDKQNII